VYIASNFIFLPTPSGILAKFSVAVIAAKLSQKYGAKPNLDLGAARDADPGYIPPGYVPHSESQAKILTAFYEVNDPSKLAKEGAVIKVRRCSRVRPCIRGQYSSTHSLMLTSSSWPHAHLLILASPRLSIRYWRSSASPS
jgi:hypothetical protein